LGLGSRNSQFVELAQFANCQYKRHEVHNSCSRNDQSTRQSVFAHFCMELSLLFRSGVLSTLPMPPMTNWTCKGIDGNQTKSSNSNNTFLPRKLVGGGVGRGPCSLCQLVVTLWLSLLCFCGTTTFFSQKWLRDSQILIYCVYCLLLPSGYFNSYFEM